MSLADVRLRPYDSDIAITFKGKRYPAYVLMEHLLWVTDKRGKAVKFILNPQQVDLYEAICMQRRTGEPVRQNILKARQVGYSTFIAGLIFLIAMYTPNVLAGVAADKLSNAKRIFRKYEFFYRHLDDSNPLAAEIREYERMGKTHPATNKPSLLSSRGSTLLETRANSRIEVIVADDEAGRGGTYHLLHLSECAFYKDLHETLNGLLETVADDNSDSYVFLETTANGFNEYKERWDADDSGDTSYNPTFTPWFTNPEYADHRFDPGGTPLKGVDEWLLDKQKRHGLTDAQIAWYWRKLRTKGDRALMLQEYPFSPSDAFRSSGSCIFDADGLGIRLGEVSGTKPLRGKFPVSKRVSSDGSMISLDDADLAESPTGCVHVFERPVPGHWYIMNLDPAMGGEDAYVCQVIDNCELRQVAKICAVAPRDDEIAYQMVLLARYYGESRTMISAECNNANGTYVLDLCRKCGHRLIFKDPDYGRIGDRFEDRYGYRTTSKNKNPMVTLFKLAFQDDYRMIADPATLHEMESFCVVETPSGGETYQASGHGHDDHVMAMCGCMYIRETRLVPFLPDKAEEKRDRKMGEPIGPFAKKKGKSVKGVYQIW